MNFHQIFSITLSSEDLTFLAFCSYVPSTVVIATLWRFWGLKHFELSIAQTYVWIFSKGAFLSYPLPGLGFLPAVAGYFFFYVHISFEKIAYSLNITFSLQKWSHSLLTILQNFLITRLMIYYGENCFSIFV